MCGQIAVRKNGADGKFPGNDAEQVRSMGVMAVDKEPDALLHREAAADTRQFILTERPLVFCARGLVVCPAKICRMERRLRNCMQIRHIEANRILCGLVCRV